ncbi:serine/threonine-protein kinase [Smaragdicoccus niigatensis]|uniref:serine/threonine-protein kinase n=1 Tax=Smaragdicoccus niigatensis TaxID=359359 RepID=UPI002480E2A5|nr:serine/threonine-protein kinase [Smaragdicoccus niigatensis]
MLKSGQTFARYQIIRPLGSGGMGEVYLALNPRLGRQEALKTLYPHLTHDYQMRRRFEREASLTAQLDHPNIVSVYDADHDSASGIEWISMKYIVGRDASGLIADHQAGVEPARAVDIISQAAAGLNDAHEHGLLHRDVKPANLLISEDWRGHQRLLHVYVTDFGIARTLTNSTALTSHGSFLGTLLYAAPEMMSGTEEVDHRIDVYSLGATLFQLLTGVTPFSSREPAGLVNAHLNQPVPRVSQRCPSVPVAVDDVIATAMAKDRDNRFESCSELAEAASAALVAPLSKPAVFEVKTPWPANEVKEHRRRQSVEGTTANTPPPLPPPTSALGTNEIARMVAPPPPPPPVSPRRPFPAENAGLFVSPPARNGVRAAAKPKRRININISISIAILALIVAAGAIAWWPRGEDGNPAPVTPTSAQSRALTFADMEQFLRGHYALLPDRVDAAWQNLSPKLQDKVGGYTTFLRYWRTVKSVAVSQVLPRDGTSVNFTLDVILLDGGVGTEERTATFAQIDGRLIVDAIETLTYTMPSRPGNTSPPANATTSRDTATTSPQEG